MPRRPAPLVTIILVLTNLVIFLQELLDGGQKACETYGLIPARASLESLVTYSFFHASLAHVFGNMAFLAVVGVLAELSLGHGLFLLLYGASAVAGGALHVLADPSSTTPLVGASGAIFGVLAVVAVLRPRLLGFVIAFAGVEIWHAFMGGNGDVSFACHLGGLAAGVIVAAVLRATDSEVLEVA